MTKHTPGPWVARPDPNALLPDDWCVGIGDSLANIDKVAVCSERDARLIAAAPDLLDALQALCEYAETSDDCQYGTLSTKFVRDVALPAIAKATGESHEPA